MPSVSSISCVVNDGGAVATIWSPKVLLLLLLLLLLLVVLPLPPVVLLQMLFVEIVPPALDHAKFCWTGRTKPQAEDVCKSVNTATGTRILS